MQKPILNLLKNNQLLQLTSNHSYVKSFFLKKTLNKYSISSAQYNNIRSTRWVPICSIQGKAKKILKVYGFNRHVMRNLNLRSSLKQFKTNSW